MLHISDSPSGGGWEERVNGVDERRIECNAVEFVVDVPGFSFDVVAM